MHARACDMNNPTIMSAPPQQYDGTNQLAKPTVPAIRRPSAQTVLVSSGPEGESSTECARVSKQSPCTSTSSAASAVWTISSTLHGAELFVGESGIRASCSSCNRRVTTA
eukprot:6194335-Pleurochrysis_carterae.AAC.3